MEQLMLFFEKAKADTGIQEKLSQIPENSTEGLIALAAEHGFAVTQDDLSKTKQLNEEEMAAASGGYEDAEGGCPSWCMFIPHGYVEKRDGKHWQSCVMASSYAGRLACATTCACAGSSRCVEGKHTVTVPVSLPR